MGRETQAQEIRRCDRCIRNKILPTYWSSVAQLMPSRDVLFGDIYCGDLEFLLGILRFPEEGSAESSWLEASHPWLSAEHQDRALRQYRVSGQSPFDREGQKLL